jgi:hypothetical protein
MLVNLYGDRGLVFQTLATGFKEAHLQDKIKFDVVEADKVGSKFKEAVKEAYNAKFLDDADMIIRFAEPVQAQPEQGGEGEQPPAEGDNAQPTPDETTPPEENVEQKPEEQKPEKNAGAEEKPEEEKPESEKEQAPEEKPEEKKDDKKEKVNEAETTASGTDLKKKIVDTVKRCLFQDDESKIELSDLQGFIDGYNVSFIKVSLKEKETVAAEPAQ